MDWVKRKGMCSEESVIHDGIFEGRVILHLVSKNIVVESGIRDGFLNSCDVLYIFFYVLKNAVICFQKASLIFELQAHFFYYMHPII